MPVRDGDKFDVIIIGRGFVGATLGLALAGAGVRCLIVEAAAGAEAVTAPRPIALAYGSRKILAGLGQWPAIEEHASPIRGIHVSDRGRFGFARIRAEDYGVDALGYVSDARDVASVFAHAVSNASPALQILQPYAPTRAVFDQGGVRVDCGATASGAPDLSLSARLLVAADGGQSNARALAGISVREVDWRQSAISATLTSRLDHEQVAFERFTEDGPVALLPLARRTSGLVWTLPGDKADRMMDLDDSEFTAAIGRTFGSRLGSFTHAGPRTRHRLFSVHSRGVIKPRFALAGNAANHLHPVAGQGLNLGLRDAAALAEVVIDALRRGEDPGSMPVLRRYADWRQGDQRLTAEFTGGVVRLFSNDYLPLAAVRDLALLGLDSFGFIKGRLARHAMGVAGRSSRLARGLPL